MKTIVKRTIGYWCLEYDCWPEDHPGCTKREDDGCSNCPKSIYTITSGIKDGKESPEQEIIQ
jgi:hypothetical protein